MTISSELEAMRAQIRDIILRGSEGFFDGSTQNENLQITVRIACEFYLFLRRSGGNPELSEADYMAGMIASGVDWFFSMAQTGGILTGLKLRRGFGQELPLSLPELKLSYDATFQQLLECTHGAKAVGLLLSLAQMMCLFMTAYFPSFLSFNERGPD